MTRESTKKGLVASIVALGILFVCLISKKKEGSTGLKGSSRRTQFLLKTGLLNGFTDGSAFGSTYNNASTLASPSVANSSGSGTGVGSVFADGLALAFNDTGTTSLNATDVMLTDTTSITDTTVIGIGRVQGSGNATGALAQGIGTGYSTGTGTTDTMTSGGAVSTQSNATNAGSAETNALVEDFSGSPESAAAKAASISFGGGAAFASSVGALKTGSAAFGTP